MPIIGWVIYILISIVIVIICAFIAIDSNMVSVLSVVAFCLCFILFLAMHWYFNNTATGRRVYKSQESNFNNGIDRVVRVYDVNGQLITEYEGKFDITYDNDRILFDDQNGKRHVIYYPTGTVTVDEK